MMASMDARGGSLQHSYPTMPASPTLTNPDMILPDYDLASNPNLDDEARSQSPLMMWKNSHAATSGNDFHQQLFSGAPDHHAFPAGTMTPTTPIIYGNGTMLSDIGEVTEAESTPGRSSTRSTHRRGVGSTGSIDSVDGTFGAAAARSRSASPIPPPHSLRHTFQQNHHQNVSSSRDSLVDTPLRSSPTMGVDPANTSSGGPGKVSIKQRARQQQQKQHQATKDHARRDSIDSNSTITTQDQVLFADFDDSVSVGDSVFQGDDEESVAESYSYVAETYIAREMPITSTAASSALLTVPSLRTAGSSSGNASDDGERRLSGVSLSLRAEKILANAKKRLTTMEGNLNRARSSLYISPTAGSFPSDGSTPSPKTPPARSATAGSRYHDPLSTSPIHARILSDGSVPPNGADPVFQLQRSASALGSAGGYRQPSRSGDAVRDSPGSSRLRTSYSSNAVENTLGRLNEVEGPEASEASTFRETTQLETFLSPESRTYYNDKGLARSASVAQMRDLKDQMKDLKGKISTLRDQARADNLKRRSLQTLQTPSPFTNAPIDQWYTEPKSPQETQSTAKSVERGSPRNGEFSSMDNGGNAKRPETPPPRQLAEPVGFTEPAPTLSSAPFSGSAGSHSGSFQSSRRIPPRGCDEDETDEASVISSYEGGSDNSVVHPRLSGPVRRGNSSPILYDGPSAGTFGAGTSDEVVDQSTDGMYDSDDLDDLRTQDGDALDDDEAGSAQRGAMDEGIGMVSKEINGRPLVSQDDYEDGGGYESEGGESLYHDSVQHQISHEDRDDAFDYEHFILHSALGTISQQRMVGRERSDSFSSEDSVETTRGPGASTGDGAVHFSPSRRASMSSIATAESTDSFATAIEGRTSQAGQISPDLDDILPDMSVHTRQHRTDSLLLDGPSDGPTPSRSASADSIPDPAAPLAKRNSAEEPRRTQQPALVARRPASSAAIPGHRPSVSSFESVGTMRIFPLVNRNRLGSVSTGNMAGSVAPIGTGGGSSAALPPFTYPTPFSGVHSADDEDLREVSATLMSETANVIEQQQAAADASEVDSRPSTRSSTHTQRLRQSMDSQRSQFGAMDGAGEYAGSRSSTHLPDRMSASQAQALQELSKEDQYMVERLVGNLGRCVLGLSEYGRASAESRAFRRRIDAARRILEGVGPM